MALDALDVLIVDDSSAIRQILQRILQHTDLPLGSIHHAADGFQALAMLEANPVSLMLSDINMPNMDGLQLLTQLRANAAWNKIPVVMITTEGGEAKVLQALELGANGYIRKPFTPEQIRETITGLKAQL